MLCYWGFNATSGVPLKDCTKVGLSLAVQQYGNLPVWLEEFQSDSPPELIERIKNLFNRESGIKKTYGEPKRQVRTSVIITGEANCTDAQVRSRYPHILVSAARHQADHYRWLEEHSPDFRFLGRHIMRNRQEFSEHLLKVLDTWMEHPELKSVDPRAKLVYGIAYELSGNRQRDPILPKDR